MHRTNRTAQILTIVFVWQYLLLLGLQFGLNGMLSWRSEFFSLGLDFRFFYDAAHHWLAHTNPYSDPNFTSPPASILVALPFVHVPFETATSIWRVCNVVLILGSVLALCRTLRLSPIESTCLFLITLTFASTHALVWAGNMDAVMLALVVVAYSSRHTWIRILSLGFSLALKAYTGVLLIPLLRRKQWKMAVLLVGVAILATVPFLSLLPEAMARVGLRSGVFRTNGNISPGLLFMLALHSHPLLWKICYWAFWAGTLAFAVRNDKARDSIAWPIAYIPWMLAAPVLVLRYVALLNIAVIARLVRINRERSLTTGEWMMLAGSVVLGLYPATFVALLPLSPEQNQHYFTLFDPINAIGVAVLVVGTAIASKSWLQPLPEEHTT